MRLLIIPIYYIMLNRGAFAGKTVFVTGASRGIGKAVALKFAGDGANVVIAAKTVDPHPKLQGTIIEAADEVTKLGGKGLAVQLDLRDESSIIKAVDMTIEKFGGIDILINNASAIHLATATDLPSKRFDLMNSINVRGTFLMSKHVIPHLKKASNPHIINMSPPVLLHPQWFSSHTAYTMAKYGMSLAAYGLSAELRGEVAVNALWPKTAIWTAAMNMLGGEEARKGSRKPEILADAAYAIACRPKTVTGNFYIDEEVLKEEGIKDFEQYAMEPGADLLPDFYLPDRVLKDFGPDVLKAFGRSVAGVEIKPTDSTEDQTSESDINKGPVGAVFASFAAVATEEMKQDINAFIHFIVSGKDWTVMAKKSKPFEISNAKPSEDSHVNCTLITDELTFLKMARGETKPTSAFMTGKLKIKGSMGVALKIEKLFMKLKAKL